MRRVCVYAGSNPGSDPAYAGAPRGRSPRLLAERGIGLVYGGGNVGLMGVLADTALAAGGEVIGVMPQALVDREIGHRGLTELRVVGSMHERKALMAELSDAFVAVPGGIGTLEELIEVYTWSQLGIHDKPCGVLNVRGYYDALAAFLDHAVERGLPAAAAPRRAQRGGRPGRAARAVRGLRAADGGQVAGARSDLTLRPLDDADVPELSRIIATPEVARWWDERIAVEEDDGDATHLTIEIGGKVAGFVQYGEETDAEVPPRQHRHLRRSRAARARLRHPRDRAARAAPGRGARPSPDHDRPGRRTTRPAIRAYEKAGFRPVGVMRRYEREHGDRRVARRPADGARGGAARSGGAP